jgi:urease accessory protein
MRTGLTRVIGVAFTLVTLAPTTASAHIGNGGGHGFVHGFLHPLGGADHVLAMVAVGLLAWQLGGRALWLLPATFMAVMALGGMLAFAGAALPGIEPGIAASVIVLGALVALGVKAPVAIAAAIAGMFAIFHGHAHGSEFPDGAAAAAYASGFLSATALLHVGGVGLGERLGRMSEASGLALHRLGGAGVALAGVALLGRII